MAAVTPRNRAKIKMKAKRKIDRVKPTRNQGNTLGVRRALKKQAGKMSPDDMGEGPSKEGNCTLQSVSAMRKRMGEPLTVPAEGSRTGASNTSEVECVACAGRHRPWRTG